MVNRNNIIENISIRANFRMVRVSHLTENRKVASIGVCSFVATVTLDYSSSVDHGGDSVEFKSLCHEQLLSLVMASNCLPINSSKDLFTGFSGARSFCSNA